jgi:hypothetical protein
MASEMENPARAARGVPETDQADGSIILESKAPLIHLQVARLTCRCAITAAMAAIVAPLVYGEAS